MHSVLSLVTITAHITYTHIYTLYIPCPIIDVLVVSAHTGHTCQNAWKRIYTAIVKCHPQICNNTHTLQQYRTPNSFTSIHTIKYNTIQRLRAQQKYVHIHTSHGVFRLIISFENHCPQTTLHLLIYTNNNRNT